ncbi:LysR family transcriptional regulator [Sporosarcina contaminans]|uniref:LysR family transcriptional regulator n=1 Tax=Sporosarcina contaminans TaxID=633403 RepID=A0ABW3TXR6_9BACL
MDQQLQIFITVAEKESFSQAAKEHHMTQPAVSQYIRQFEDQFGTRLLERSNKYVRLTKAGEIVFHHGKEILALYGKMQNLCDDLLNQASGTLSIGASYTFGEYVLPRILSNLKRTYPTILPAVTIGNTNTIADLVASHQLDIGIVEGQFEQVKLIKEELAEDEMVVVAPPNHPFAKRAIPLKANELEQEMWIKREIGSGTREAMEQFFERFNISPKQTMSFSSTQPIKESVEAGLGISLLSTWAIQKEVRNEDLCILSVEGLPFLRKFSIITSTPFQTKALEVFIDLLRTRAFLRH